MGSTDGSSPFVLRVLNPVERITDSIGNYMTDTIREDSDPKSERKEKGDE